MDPPGCKTAWLQVRPRTHDAAMLAEYEAYDAGYYPEINIAIIHESVLK